MPFVGSRNTRITNLRWRTAAILEKSKNRHISATVWPSATKCGKLMQFDPCESQKFEILKIQGGAAAILKNRKFAIPQQRGT